MTSFEGAGLVVQGRHPSLGRDVLRRVTRDAPEVGLLSLQLDATMVVSSSARAGSCEWLPGIRFHTFSGSL